MRKLRAVLLSLFVLNFGLPCVAQNSQKNELYFNSLTVENGLPEGQVFDFLQDKYGYMWLATQDGLVRYDGYNCKVYRFDIKHSFVIVTRVFEDKTGTIWAGVEDETGSIYRYDRTKDSFTRCPMTIPGTNRSSRVRTVDLQLDGRGNIWAVALNALEKTNYICRLNPQTGKYIYYGCDQKGKYKIAPHKIYNLYPASGGNIFITSDNGLYEYDNIHDQLVAHFATADSLKSLNFYAPCEDPLNKNIVWASEWDPRKRTSALCRFNKTDHSVKLYKYDPRDTTSIASDDLYDIQKDSKNHLWLATSGGLSLFDRVKDRFINYTPTGKRSPGGDNEIYIIKKDKNGNFWCTRPHGLAYFDTQYRHFTNYPFIRDVSGANSDNFEEGFSGLLIDKNGTIWGSANGGGLKWLNTNRTKFSLYSEHPNQPRNFPGGHVYSFAAIKDSDLYLSSDHGIYHWQTKTDSFSLVGIEKNNLGQSMITIDHEGRLWIGTYNSKGLFYYDPKTHITINFLHKDGDPTSLPGDKSGYVFADRDDNIWVGTWGNGICRFDRRSKKFIPYPFDAKKTGKKNVLDNGYVSSVYQDEAGTIWAGTFAGGLNKYDPVKDVFIPQKLPGVIGVVSIYEDSRKKLWLGTYLDGAFEFDKSSNKVKHLSENNGLLFKNVSNITEDADHNIWFISVRGITILNPRDNSFRYVTKESGLPENQNYFQFGSLFKTKKDQLLFGTAHGFIKVNAGSFAVDTVVPEMHIETVMITKSSKGGSRDSAILTFGKKDIRFQHDKNRVTFSYVGLKYQNAAFIRYAYRLDGYDKDWINAGTARQATYTNLSPGTYTFHVKAANSDGVWSTEDEAITIIIASPWWGTWWAYLIYAVTFPLVIIKLIVDERSKKLKRENKLLEEKVASRTEELKQSLDDLKSAQKQLIQSEKMASLGELTAGIAHEIQNPLNFVNNFSEINTDLITELEQELEKGDLDEAKILTGDIRENEQKISHHGKRADAIVKGMLQHSRKSSGQKELIDINALADEYLKLSYHGLRAKDKSFSATIHTDFDKSIGTVNIVGQDVGRVLLNLYNNAFYAVTEKKSLVSNGYVPTVSVSTKIKDNNIQIIVKDNGNGIPRDIVDKIFQPFFTTKPTGQGTGLGLSLSYDVIEAHGGKITVETHEDEGTEFIIIMPQD